MQHTGKTAPEPPAGGGRPPTARGVAAGLCAGGRRRAAAAGRGGGGGTPELACFLVGRRGSLLRRRSARIVQPVHRVQHGERGRCRHVRWAGGGAGGRSCARRGSPAACLIRAQPSGVLWPPVGRACSSRCMMVMRPCRVQARQRRIDGLTGCCSCSVNPPRRSRAPRTIDTRSSRPAADP
eukprot:COSAG01_NODE_502_length_16182_cov_24.914257_2_plen_181_part_00